MRSRWGYLIGLVFLAASIGWVILIGVRLLDSVEAMPRVAMPGVGELVLPEGDIAFYAEPGGVKARCKLVGDAGEVALEQPTGRTSYSIGERHGESMFSATLPKAGSYRMTCDAQTHFEIAAGHIGAGIVMLVVGGIVLLGLGVAISVVTFVRRRSKRV